MVYPNTMRSLPFQIPNEPQARPAALDRLRLAMEALAHAGQPARATLATGWARDRSNHDRSNRDGSAPHADLAFGALHEWFGLASDSQSNAQSLAQPLAKSLSLWIPPLCLLAHLAACSLAPLSSPVSSISPVTPRAATPAILWIGQRVWPYGHALKRHPRLFEASICINTHDKAQQFWAIDLALRSAGTGAVIIADASGLPLAMSRRLQLAAESGGSLALLARPPWEERELSVAATRWRVRSAAGSSDTPRWSLTLMRCKGSQTRDTQPHILEQTHDGRLIALSPGLAHRPRATALAS